VSPQDKAPAYQWYVRDYMSDEAVALMSYEQQGIYRALLDRQWLEGSIPADPSQIAAILRVPAAKFTKLWPAVAVKFKPSGEGRLANGRMERERAKAEEYREAKARAGASGGKAKAQAQAKQNVAVLDSATSKPEANPSSSSASSSSPASSSAVKSGDARASVLPMRSPRSMGALGTSPAQHIGHGRCNDRGVCMPTALYTEILGRFANDVSRFDAFYDGILAQMPDDFVPAGSVFRFWHDMLERAHPNLTPKVNARQAALEADF
jgi:uncharacterized protein YdaU (DUF1376 family)